MRRWERPLLLFSVALNVAFLTIGATRSVTREEPAPRLLAPDSPRAARHLERWREHRHATMARRLGLQPDQIHALDSEFEQLRPELRNLRQEVVRQRTTYAQALARGDVATARAAARSVASAQSRVDSLCAEAMIRETSVMHPEQRTRYVRWTFRVGPGHGRSPDGLGRRGPRPTQVPPASRDSLDPHEERISP